MELRPRNLLNTFQLVNSHRLKCIWKCIYIYIYHLFEHILS